MSMLSHIQDGSECRRPICTPDSILISIVYGDSLLYMTENIITVAIVTKTAMTLDVVFLVCCLTWYIVLYRWWLITTCQGKGVGKGGLWPPGPKILPFWPLKRPKIGIEPPPGNWKMAGEPFPGARESPPLDKFLPTPLCKDVRHCAAARWRLWRFKWWLVMHSP